MNLIQAITITAGGPGSGCHGSNCGRKGNGKNQITSDNMRVKYSVTGETTRLELSKGKKFVGSLDYYSVGKGTVETDYLGVAKLEQGKGYAKSLYKTLFAKLKDKGIRIVQSSDELTEGGHGVWKSLAGEYPISYANGRFRLKLKDFTQDKK